MRRIPPCNKLFLLSYSLLMLTTFAVFAPKLSAETASESWSLEALLAWGLKNHPLLQQAEGSIVSAKARLGQSQTTLSTKITTSAGYNRRRQEFSSAWRSGISHDDLTDSTNNSIAVQKVINDSGRTRELIKAGDLSLKASLRDRDTQRIEIANDIKTAYYQTLQAKAMIKVQSDSLEGFKTHLQKTRGYVEVGTRPPFDITTAEVDVANAQVNLIKAESNYRNTLAELARTTGLEETIEIMEPASQPEPISHPMNEEEFHRELQNRPDIAAADLRIQAATHQLNNAKKGLKPTLSTSASYGWQGTYTPLDRAWVVGLNLNIPVLDGKMTKYQKMDAEGSLISARSHLSSVRVDARAALETAITGVADAFKRYEASNVLLRQASESLKLAEGRYDAGLGSPIEITDARTQYSNARGTLVTAFYDTLIALTRLDLALGKFPEEHHQ
ncbi:MAG: TolC family protein [Candidatus Riflebacteria bacterium]|nr:TolC family protein [Candidatus Riflebacteria bacterium]